MGLASSERVVRRHKSFEQKSIGKTMGGEIWCIVEERSSLLDEIYIWGPDEVVMAVGQCTEMTVSEHRK